jgi:hypothetical protein
MSLFASSLLSLVDEPTELTGWHILCTCDMPLRTNTAFHGRERVYGDLSLGSPEGARICKEQSAGNDVQYGALRILADSC